LFLRVVCIIFRPIKLIGLYWINRQMIWFFFHQKKNNIYNIWIIFLTLNFMSFIRSIQDVQGGSLICRKIRMILLLPVDLRQEHEKISVEVHYTFTFTSKRLVISDNNTSLSVSEMNVLWCLPLFFNGRRVLFCFFLASSFSGSSSRRNLR
jgi:hypothetical protein